MDGSASSSSQIVQAVDEVGQTKQIIDLVKENKVITALVVFVLWQTGTLLEIYTNVHGGMC